MSTPKKLSDQILEAHEILRCNKILNGCISFVQRRLACSYNRAALLIAFLEDAKVIEVPNHAGDRRWLMDRAPAVERLKEMI